METTSNQFARVLIFYYEFIRNKLTEYDLDRIAKQFKSKPDKMLEKLAEKYPYFHIRLQVTATELGRCLSTFTIPQSYRDLLKDCEVLISSNQTYDASLDVISPTFDPNKALLVDKYIIATDLSISPCDNISKVCHLLPISDPAARSTSDSNSPTTLSSPIPTTTIVSTTTQREIERPASRIKEDRRHFFDILADVSTPTPAVFFNLLGEKIDMKSPLALLYTFMKDKQRIRIIIRRNLSVRGSIDGYLKAFDRFWNLLLYDVDEEYITNKQRKRAMTLGKFVNQTNVLHRHLPQLLVRGDTIVSIFRKPIN